VSFSIQVNYNLFFGFNFGEFGKMGYNIFERDGDLFARKIGGHVKNSLWVFRKGSGFPSPHQ